MSPSDKKALQQLAALAALATTYVIGCCLIVRHDYRESQANLEHWEAFNKAYPSDLPSAQPAQMAAHRAFYSKLPYRWIVGEKQR